MIWPIFAVFLPLLFAVVVWAVVTACRLLMPEEVPLPFAPDEAYMRAQQTHPVRVGAREIRADIRFRQRHETTSYSYCDHVSGGLPESWWDDVAHRLN